MAVTDAYAVARSNLRDNVKTLIGIFGGAVGLLLAGTPFSGYGALELLSPAWWIATVGLIGAVGLVGWALHILLFVLRPDLAYSQDLVSNFSTKPPANDPLAPEIDALQKEFARHKVDLLPKEVKTVKELDEAADAAWTEWEQDPTDTKRKYYDDLTDALQRLNYWSGFVRFHFRVTRGTDKCLVLGFIALFFVAVFALAASPKKAKDEKTPQTVVVNTSEAPPKSDAPSYPMTTVRFETNRSALSTEALTQVAAIRDHLRARPTRGILVYAYTDTRGGQKLNQDLAQRRAAAVAQSLMAEGGISPARIFASTLPKTDLPSLTTQEADTPDNRAVELRVIELPDRE